jgi:hypothetical protein
MLVRQSEEGVRVRLRHSGSSHPLYALASAITLPFMRGAAQEVYPMAYADTQLFVGSEWRDAADAVNQVVRKIGAGLAANAR